MVVREAKEGVPLGVWMFYTQHHLRLEEWEKFYNTTLIGHHSSNQESNKGD